MANINSWWSALTSAEQVFWLIAIPFTLIFIIQLLMTIIGVSSDHGLDNFGDSDMDVDSDAGIGFQFISLKNFIAFFTIFGWTGLACLDGGLGIGLSVFIAIIAGLIMMVIMASLFYFMGKLTESGNFKINSAIGHTGTVYLRIPAAKSGVGKIQINVSGLKTLDAVTNHTEDIKSGSLIKVVDVNEGNILVVEPL